MKKGPRQRRGGSTSMSGDYNPYGSSYGSTMSGSASYGGKPAARSGGGAT